MRLELPRLSARKQCARRWAYAQCVPSLRRSKAERGKASLTGLPNGLKRRFRITVTRSTAVDTC